jgi:hypothetical protein
LNVHSNDFSLLYATSGLSLDPISTVNTATLRDFWVKSVDAGIHIKPKDVKSRILSLIVKVDYPIGIKKRMQKGRLAVVSSDDDDNTAYDDVRDYTVSVLFPFTSGVTSLPTSSRHLLECQSNARWMS